MNLWNTDEIDYKALGFRCGIEIHQQLDTKTKLFCHCPVGLVEDEPDARILRHMRPTLSEMGEYDGTALMEKKTRKEIIYEILNDRVCTYEMDDTPPFLINRKAIDIGITLSLLFQCSIVDEAHIARKQYLDGSIPTGFQRTTLIGTDGWVPYKNRRIRVRQVNVEEDSCREVSDKGHRIVFRTDRLSIPLVEVITDPEMLDPIEAGEVTMLLAETNRISGLVRRGIGTARQDVNVSITGGSRVEIKGVEKIRYIPLLTHFEALRQKALLDIKNEIHGRGILLENFRFNTADVTKHLERTPEFSGSYIIAEGGIVGAVSIKGFRGIFESYIFPERLFGDEIAGRVRVIACLDNLPNIAYGINRAVIGVPEKEWENIRNAVSAEGRDAVVITWGPKEDVETALSEIAQRCREAIQGVPEETRQVLSNGRYTGFERILPGPDRMYPDTDHPPICIEENRIEEAKIHIPSTPWERRKELAKMGLSKQLIDELVVHEKYDLFVRAAEISGDPKWAARLIAETLKFLKRKLYTTSNISDKHLIELAEHYEKKKFYKEGTTIILKYICQNDCDVHDAVEETIPKIPSEEIEDIAQELIYDDHGPRDPDKHHRYKMGQAMRKYCGAIPGKILWDKISQTP